MENVVISGIGIVGPHGVGHKLSSSFSPWPDDVQHASVNPKIAQVAEMPAREFFTDRQMRLMDRAMLLSSTAAGYALRDAGLDAEQASDACSFLGTARAELPSSFKFLRPRLGNEKGQLNAADFPKIARNVSCGQVAIRFGLTGPSTVLASGALSSIEAVQRAVDHIKAGRVSMALVGGYEALSKFSLFYFSNRYAQASAGEAPSFFGGESGQLIPSEGACVLLLESESSASARGISPYCRIEQWDGGRLSPNESGAKRLMTSWRNLAKDDGIGLFCVSSGGSNRTQERLESEALEMAIAEQPDARVFAPRSYVGEGESWTSALQVGIAAHCIKSGTVMPSAAVSEAANAPIKKACAGGELAYQSAIVSGVADGQSFGHLLLKK